MTTANSASLPFILFFKKDTLIQSDRKPLGYIPRGLFYNFLVDKLIFAAFDS